MTNEMTIEQLQELVTKLSSRVDELEAKMAEAHPAGQVSPDVLLAISAACAAYLGKRATVKQVHMRRASTWTSIGRTSIHRSHRAGA